MQAKEMKKGGRKRAATAGCFISLPLPPLPPFAGEAVGRGMRPILLPAQSLSRPSAAISTVMGDRAGPPRPKPAHAARGSTTAAPGPGLFFSILLSVLRT